MKAALRGDSHKTPAQYDFRALSLDDVLSPDFGREQLYYLDMTGRMARVRRNGAVKTWKRDPSRVSIPVKFGMYEAFRVDNPGDLYVRVGANPRRRLTRKASRFIGRKIRRLVHEGMKAPRRVAAAYSIARRRGFKVPLANPMSRKDFELMAAMIADRQLHGEPVNVVAALTDFAVELGKATNARFDADRFARRILQLVGEKRPYRYVNNRRRVRGNPVLSESKTLTTLIAAVKRIARRESIDAAMPELRELVVGLGALKDQAERGIHANPALAIVGANPPGKLLGYVTGQLRYRRTIGQHPGWYQHTFKTRARLLAMPDGSLRIAS